MSTATAIWWLRRDLRLHDNQALDAAIAHGGTVIPLFIIDPTILNSRAFSPTRYAFMLDGLRDLDAELRKRGSRLVIREGDITAQLARVVEENGADAIFAEEDYTPYARRRDAAVADSGLPLTLTGGLTVRHPRDVTKKAGGPYTVFTPYSRTWKGMPLPRRQGILSAPDALTTPDMDSLPIPDAPQNAGETPFVAGESAAREQLETFAANRIYQYDDKRNRVDLDGTSRLSPYLRFGMLSARETVVTALEAIAQSESDDARKQAQTWLTELIWREFYHMILFTNPHVRRGNYRSQYDGIEWINDEATFDAWCNGQTGVPIVDAAMRQLQQTGWMHNRARMIVASYLTKNLLIDWRWGERWFMQHLVDGDLAANNGGWQWSAGTGTDAAPYFRIFNPVSQSKKFDPDGNYIRRWVPELRPVPDRDIHEPYAMPPMEQKRHDVIIGETYPRPLVDLKTSRQRALDAYKRAREQADKADE